MNHGFLRVAAASPVVRVADVAFNLERHLSLLNRAQDEGVDLIVYPECGLTGYTCGDLFHQQTLIEAAAEALRSITEATKKVFDGVAVVGLPWRSDGKLFNVAAVVHDGQLVQIVSKRFLPNYSEFYDSRYFHSRSTDEPQPAPIAFGNGHRMGVEVCEDLWVPEPPSGKMALGGATVLCNLSASPETVGKHDYRRQLILQQSARCLAAYLYASAGVGESTQDLVFGGHCLIAENGHVLAESDRYQRGDQFLVADIDLERLAHERLRTTTFVPTTTNPPCPVVEPVVQKDLRRTIDPHPFVPSNPETRSERCREIFSIQVAGLAKRLEHIGKPTVSIGVSGGLDSTLALLVLIKTADLIGLPREKIVGLTMPGFGTTGRTLKNAHHLMREFGITTREIDIRSICLEQMNALGHKPFGLSLDGESPDSLTAKLRQLPNDKRQDLTFENIQARARTSFLMNAGFQIGTGDMSELALGWCTYNADHMSMYNPNVSVPKTLVRFLVSWAADHEFDGPVRAVLHDVADTVISPELLPTTATGEIAQATEATVGPYELHDFFLYHFVRYGTPPEKILFLATHAHFDGRYSTDDIRQWLVVFLKRFFSSQYKRSCIPDGPKVGSVSLSPRGDWRMPSDAVATEWIRRLESSFASSHSSPPRQSPGRSPSK
jgi:NAD+ synthase (glutamine-hydrolysing)